LVGGEDHSVACGGALGELEAGEVVFLFEEALAGAEDEVVDHKEELVDEGVGQERADERAAAHDDEIAGGLPSRVRWLTTTMRMDVFRGAEARVTAGLRLAGRVSERLDEVYRRGRRMDEE
jgi:hypothetical protein